MIRHQVKTHDDVTIHVVETGNLSRPAVLFVHGISQSWRSWLAQFADRRLRERFRLVALDLRGQGAFGAVDQKGNPLPALADERYKISDRRSPNGRSTRSAKIGAARRLKPNLQQPEVSVRQMMANHFLAKANLTSL